MQDPLCRAPHVLHRGPVEEVRGLFNFRPAIRESGIVESRKGSEFFQLTVDELLTGVW